MYMYILCMFQVFCSHLEQLIQRLYTVSEKMELLAAPTVDIDSVKSSLAQYQVKAAHLTHMWFSFTKLGVWISKHVHTFVSVKISPVGLMKKNPGTLFFFFYF